MKKRMALLITSSGMEAAYAPWMMAATAAAMDYECRLFYAFGGLDLLRVQPLIRGDMDQHASAMPEPVALRAMCLEQGVELLACSASLTARGLSEDDLLPSTALVGMASWLLFASKAEIQLSFT